MPGVHRVANLLRRWILGTHWGSVDPVRLRVYLEEFASGSTAAPLGVGDWCSGASSNRRSLPACDRCRCQARLLVESRPQDVGVGGAKPLSRAIHVLAVQACPQAGTDCDFQVAALGSRNKAVVPESDGASEGETSTVLGGCSLLGNLAALCSLVTPWARSWGTPGKTKRLCGRW